MADDWEVVPLVPVKLKTTGDHIFYMNPYEYELLKHEPGITRVEEKNDETDDQVGKL